MYKLILACVNLSTKLAQIFELDTALSTYPRATASKSEIKKLWIHHVDMIFAAQIIETGYAEVIKIS